MALFSGGFVSKKDTDLVNEEQALAQFNTMMKAINEWTAKPQEPVNFVHTMGNIAPVIITTSTAGVSPTTAGTIMVDGDGYLKLTGGFVTSPQYYGNGTILPETFPNLYGSVVWPNTTITQMPFQGFPDLGLEPGENVEEVLAEFREWRRQRKEKPTLEATKLEYERLVEL